MIHEKPYLTPGKGICTRFCKGYPIMCICVFYQVFYEVLRFTRFILVSCFFTTCQPLRVIKVIAHVLNQSLGRITCDGIEFLGDLQHGISTEMLAWQKQLYALSFALQNIFIKEQ